MSRENYVEFEKADKAYMKMAHGFRLFSFSWAHSNFFPASVHLLHKQKREINSTGRSCGEGLVDIVERDI